MTPGASNGPAVAGAASLRCPLRMAVSEAQQMLDPLFSELKDGICLSNENGELMYMNPAAARLLAVDAAEAVGTRICGHVCAKLAAPGCGAECVSVCPLEARRARAATFAGRHGPRPGYQWGASGLEPRPEYGDLRVHCQALETTLFDSWEPEKRLTILEDIGAERELERMKEDWRNMIAHDLRSPLTNVFGTLRILEDSPARAHLAKEEDLLLVSSVRACARLLELLNLYLDIAKLDAGLMKTRESVVALAPLVKSCVEEQSAVARERRIKVVVDVPGEPAARADEGLLFRVAQNLLANALKFAPDGGHVWLAGRRREGWVELEVKDDGPGIAPEDRRFLFDRFFQAEARRGGKIQGTGLGLTFCREALRAMRGSIEVESAPGRGTAFLVRLPAS